MEVDGLSVEEAFFRGRKLLGATVPIPDGYRGEFSGSHVDELCWVFIKIRFFL